jgi:hypothetical protein
MKMAVDVRVDDVRTVNHSNHSRYAHLDAIEAADCRQLGSLPRCDFKALAAVVKGSHIERRAVRSELIAWFVSVDRLGLPAMSEHLPHCRSAILWPREPRDRHLKSGVGV